MLYHLQNEMKLELGSDGYCDHDMIICQANGKPIMTEHLNKRFKDVLRAMNDPEINPDEIVFHSIRHTSATVKLRLSKGDLKAVQGDGGWSTPDMVTKRYAHIMDEDRKILAEQMERQFYQNQPEEGQTRVMPVKATAAALVSALERDPELLAKVLKAIQAEQGSRES